MSRELGRSAQISGAGILKMIRLCCPIENQMERTLSHPGRPIAKLMATGLPRLACSTRKAMSGLRQNSEMNDRAALDWLNVGHHGRRIPVTAPIRHRSGVVEDRTLAGCSLSMPLQHRVYGPNNWSKTTQSCCHEERFWLPCNQRFCERFTVDTLRLTENRHFVRLVITHTGLDAIRVSRCGGLSIAGRNWGLREYRSNRFQAWRRSGWMLQAS